MGQPRPAARILIVDDEPLNVDYLEQELDSQGFATETAADGLEALDRVAAAPPDLILLDVMMPRMDGISALRVLKQDPETRLIPVVLMTALNAVEDRVRGIEAGADDFLSKPVDDRELLARIKTALSLKRAIDETVNELRSTSAQLERHGTQERDVAVLVVEWRLREPGLPDEAVAFVGRREREVAEERVQALGGTPGEGDAGMLVAVFDDPDARSRAAVAVDAALELLAEDRPRRVAARARRRRRSHRAGSCGVEATDAGRRASLGVRRGGRARRGRRRARADGGRLRGDGHGRSGRARERPFPARAGRRGRLPSARARGGGQPGRGNRLSANRRITTILVTDIVGSTRPPSASATALGESSSQRTTGPPGQSSSSSGARRSIRRGTASSRRSTARGARSAARWR